MFYHTGLTSLTYYHKMMEKTKGRVQLEKWLNKNMKIKMTDGRTLIGIFVCTDKDRNVILGSCKEYLAYPDTDKEDPRMLGLAMIPGHHIVTIHIDEELISQKIT